MTAKELLNIIAGPIDGWRLHPAVLAKRVEKLLALHVEGVLWRGMGHDLHICMECGIAWPCLTVRLLDEEE